MPNFTSAAQGFLDFTQQQQQRQMQQAYLAQQAMAVQKAQAEQEARARALAARGPAFDVLYGALKQQPQVPQPLAVTPPSPAAPPPGAMSPGGGNPQAQGMPPGAAAPQVGPQILPFKALPKSQPGAMPGGVPPIPATSPQQPDIVWPQHMDIRKIVENIHNTVPFDKRMDVFDQMKPVIQAAQQDELKFFRAQTQAQTAAIQAYRAAIEQYKAEVGGKRLEETERANRAREADRERAADQRDQKLTAALSRIGGGSGKISDAKDIYPVGPDGKPDLSKMPIGRMGVTKTNKRIVLDNEGNPTTFEALGGAPSSAGKGPGGAQAAVRKNLVLGGANNALRMLDTVEKEFKDMNVTPLLQSHSDSLVGGYLEGTARSMVGSKQQEADATWRNLIMESIPPLTGGLRGSDGFRNFLVQDAPLMGTSPKARERKIKQLRANLEGMRDIFAGKQPPKDFNRGQVESWLSTYESDPKMWGPGETRETVSATINQTRQMMGGGGSAAPAPATGGGETKQLGGKTYIKRGGQWYER